MYKIEFFLLCALPIFCIAANSDTREKSRTFLCENSIGDALVGCVAPYKMKVIDATLGRQNSLTCMRLSQLSHERCKANCTDVIKEKCEGEEGCKVRVMNNMCGGVDPCPGVKKYLQLEFECA